MLDKELTGKALKYAIKAARIKTLTVYENNWNMID